MKKWIALFCAVLMTATLGACAAPAAPGVTEVPVETATATEAPAAAEPTVAPLEAAEVQLFIAASLEGAFQEIIPLYNASQPNVTITYNADSSGTLLTQVQEGFACDVFFSASTSQVKTLEAEGYMIAGSRVDLLANKLALITLKGSGTAVTGYADLANAKSIALADGSVPAGKYTRQLLINLGVLDGTKEAKEYTTAEVAAVLGGVEINECSNVSKVKEAVKEGANEVGSVYYSDAYSVKDDVDIIEVADSALTGDILYPVCRLNNPEATAAQSAAADDFLAFLQTDAAKAIFEKYMFIINQ
ncbi:MAG: molybdate ABC transporter substrate-binding protein [Firmicutes bacterium HGW-Firmicutes-9]|jgi:molybdate transport system substrate-binding protein|nr:MAG: molybdate ABC transporter substrate-binding protein [Firmicutes bacterium HGW-Firmicutes-9]